VTSGTLQQDQLKPAENSPKEKAVVTSSNGSDTNGNEHSNTNGNEYQDGDEDFNGEEGEEEYYDKEEEEYYDEDEYYENDNYEEEPRDKKPAPEDQAKQQTPQGKLRWQPKQQASPSSQAIQEDDDPVILIMEIDSRNGKQLELRARASDKPEELAYKFCKEHNLESDQKKVEKLIAVNLEQAILKNPPKGS